jgi:rubrerythrin
MLRTLTNYWLVGAMLLLGCFAPITVEAHEFRLAAAAGQGMHEKSCPLCGQPWQGRVKPELAIPEKLPAPKNQLWIRKLGTALAMEKLAKAQFEADQKKFGVSNPYLYVLPEIEQHIAWISKLFSAYGLPAQGKTAPVLTVKTPDTLLEALKKGRKMEEELATHYSWLLSHTGNKTTQRVLNTILTQTNIHMELFKNDIRIIEIEGSMVPSLL